MPQCLIYDSSLKFSRAVYGLLTLIAIIIHSNWLILVVIVLMLLGTFSLKLNIPYELHVFFTKKVLKKRHSPSPKELGEVNFVSAMTSVLLLIGFLLIYFGKFVAFAWIYLLVVDFMIFLACLVGFCVATLMYLSLKKTFK